MPIKITTGVDKLLNIIIIEKKISVKEAASKMNTSSHLVEAWAGFLEELGKIEIKYKFRGIFLVIKSEKNQKSKISIIEKENLSKRTDNLAEFVKNLHSSIEALEDSFKKIDSRSVKKQLKDIQELDNEKHDQEKIIINEHLSTLSELEKVNESLNVKKEQISHSFFDVKEQLLSEQKILSLEKKQLALLKSNQKLVQRRLSYLQMIVSKKTKKLGKSTGELIEKTKEKIIEISEQITELKKTVKEDSIRFKKLLRLSKIKNKNINEIKKKITKEIRKSMKNLKKDTWKKMRILMDKKNSTQTILINLHREELRIKKQIETYKSDDSPTNMDKVEDVELRLKKITAHIIGAEKKVKKIYEKKKTNKKR